MNSQVKQILTVLSAAVFAGFLLAFFMIWIYGPTGQYKAGQSILSPEIIEKISFKDSHPKTGKSVNFVFDHTEFVYFDYIRGQWQQKEIPLPAYQEFYHYISLDESLLDVKEEVLRLFQRPSPTALVTTVRTDVLPTAKVFQIIQFTKEEYYRVKLHGQQDDGKWAYFYHPGSYRKIMTLFATHPSPS